MDNLPKSQVPEKKLTRRQKPKIDDKDVQAFNKKKKENANRKDKSSKNEMQDDSVDLEKTKKAFLKGNIDFDPRAEREKRRNQTISKKVLAYFDEGAKDQSSSEEEGEEKFNPQVEDEENQKFEPFNLKDLREQGHFHAQTGAYIEKEDEYDPWLAEVDENAGKDLGPIGIKNFEKRAEKMRKEEIEDQKEYEQFSPEKALGQVVSLLQPTETVLRGLQRLGDQLEQAKKSSKKSPSDKKLQAQTKQVEKDFNSLTDLSHELMCHNILDIHQMTREKITTTLTKKRNDQPVTKKAKAELIKEDFEQDEEDEEDEEEETQDVQEDILNNQNTENEDQWEYLDAEEKTFGPFPTSYMQGWRDQGYFLDDSVKVRRCAMSVLDDDEEWLPASQAVFSDKQKED